MNQMVFRGLESRDKKSEPIHEFEVLLKLFPDRRPVQRDTLCLLMVL